MSENEQRTFKRSRTLVRRDVAGTCLIVFLCVKLAFSTDGLDEFYAVLLTRIKSNQIFNCYLTVWFIPIRRKTQNAILLQVLL